MDPSYRNYPQTIVENYLINIKSEAKIDTATMKTMYYAFDYPDLNYCNHLWGKTNMTHLKPLVLLQKR